MDLKVLVTGTTVAAAQQRERQILKFLADRGAVTKIVGRTQPFVQPPQLQVHLALHALAMWGLHRSGQPTIPHTLAQRLKITPEQARLILRDWKNDYLAVGYYTGDQSEIYNHTLTPDGQNYANHWFAYLIRGCLIHAKTKNQSIAGSLAKIPGVVLSTMAYPAPIPVAPESLWLMMCWILRQDSLTIDASTLARHLSAGSEQIRSSLDVLKSKGFIINQRHTGSATGCVLTTKGAHMAQGYLARLLM